MSLRFWWKILVGLSDVFDFKKGLIKQMKIVKMTGELSPTTIRILLNILHSCKPFLVKLVNFGGKFACFEEEKKRFCKIFCDFKVGIHIQYTYLRVKNDQKRKISCHIHLSFLVQKFLYDSVFVWKPEDETGDNDEISSEELYKGEGNGSHFFWGPIYQKLNKLR